MPVPALTIVIPVYNSAKTLPELVRQVENLKIEGGHELVLVNDGSRDGSGDVCWELAERSSSFPITVVDLSRNYGEHNAVMAGLHRATGDFVIIMDDDFQNPFEEVGRLLEHARRAGSDAVFTRYEEKKHEDWRNWGSRFTNFMADLLLDKPKGLYMSSFKCISRFLVQQIIHYQGPFPYIDGLIFQVSSKIETLQVSHRAREKGSSGYTFRKLLRLWLNMFVNFSVMPLRVATIMGTAIALVGFIAAVEVVIEALIGAPTRGWGSTMATILIFSGIQLIMLGMMGEYLGRIYLTLNQKPQFIVRRVKSANASK